MANHGLFRTKSHLRTGAIHVKQDDLNCIPQVKWYKGKDGLDQIKPSVNKYDVVSHKLHRSLKITNSVDSDTDKYWCQVGKAKCSANYRVIRESFQCTLTILWGAMW